MKTAQDHYDSESYFVNTSSSVPPCSNILSNASGLSEFSVLLLLHTEMLCGEVHIDVNVLVLVRALKPDADVLLTPVVVFGVVSLLFALTGL